MYEKTFDELGYKNIGFLNIEDKEQAKKEENISRIEKANAVLFSGGDQFRISTILGGTQVAGLIHEKYRHDKHFIVGGTSAGAMIMGKTMIHQGCSEEALFNSCLKTTSGLGLLEKCIEDTHFIKRGRFGRLAHAVIVNPGQLGIGLGEDTAMLVENGLEARCLGSGMVVIIDAKDINQTNVTEVEDDSPVFVENLKVHILVNGCRFSLSKQRFVKPAMPRVKERHKK